MVRGKTPSKKAKKTTSIKIDPELWKKVKKYCIDEEIDVSDYLEKIIHKNLS